LQAQTIIAAELFTLVTEEMMLPRPPFQELVQEREESWSGMSIPFAYVKSHNPPGRSDTHQQQRLARIAQHRGKLLRGKKGLRLPTQRRAVATVS
jgi:hypothetical protein